MATRTLTVGALSLVAAGVIGAGGALACTSHVEQQHQQDFTAACRAEGGTLHTMSPDQIVGATHDGGLKVAVRFSGPVRACFE